VGDTNQTREQLIEELASLHREVAELKTTKTAFDTLHELLVTLVTTGKTVTGALMLKTVSQQILTIASRLTKAENSSLFLLDDNGIVTDSILARGAIIRDVKQRLIGSVLDKGLAGWVVRHRKIGLVIDTINDERWLTLPNEPYTVRSALAVPLLRGKELLAIVTLMHSQLGHFNQESAFLMQMSSEQMALILENALLYVERQPLQSTSNQALQQLDNKLGQTKEQRPSEDKISLLGIYIILGEGKFMYTNPGVATIFGYSFIEFITVESIFELVADNSHDFLAEQINQCFKAYSKSLSCTFKGRRKDGSLIDVQVYGTKTKFSGKPVIIGALNLI
jgi:PAS domain S-box-containing protein